MERKQLTKDDIKVIATLWTSKDVTDIAEKIGCSKHTVNNTVFKMRKLGWDLPRKRKNGDLDHLIKEAMDEM